MSTPNTSLPSRSGQGQTTRTEMRDGIVFQRYEYKYTIPPSLMDPIRSFIRPYCDMDTYAAREPDKFYTITTLYLDTQGYKTYWDKEEEVSNRFKLRIRTYGKHCEGPVKFEVKRRYNEVFLKTRVEVPRDTWPELLSVPENGLDLDFNKAEQSAFDDFIRLTRTLNATPKILVRYQRQAFTSRIDRYVRISFDRRLVHQPASACDLRGQPASWRSNDDPASMDETGPRVILELKFMTRAPVWLLELVRAFGLMRRGFSKYCTAVSRTMHAERTGRELAAAVPARTVMRRR